MITFHGKEIKILSPLSDKGNYSVYVEIVGSTGLYISTDVDALRETTKGEIEQGLKIATENAAKGIRWDKDYDFYGKVPAGGRKGSVYTGF